jgi:hypothetical protein
LQRVGQLACIDAGGYAHFGQIRDHHAGTLLGQPCRITAAVDADDQSEAAVPPGLHARDRIFDHHRARRLHTQAPRRLEEDVRRRFAFDADARRFDTVDRGVEQSGGADGFEHHRAVLAGRDDGRAEAARTQLADQLERAVVGLDAALAKLGGEPLVLAVAQAAHRLGLRRVGARAARQRDAARGQEAGHAVVAGLAVDVPEIVVGRVERHRCRAFTQGPLVQVVVEQPLPRRRVDARGPRDHAVQVEDHRIEAVRVQQQGGRGHRATLATKPPGDHPGTCP